MRNTIETDGDRGDSRPALGEQELDVLRYISDRAPVTLREVIDGYGGPRGLARTTVLTVMDRLRVKGYLDRRKEEQGPGGRRGGVYVYAPSVNKSRLLSDIVRGFVDKSLGGSLVPFVEYLVDEKGLSADEAAKLRSLIEGSGSH
jgi:predicted transcriptional regulator